MKSGPDTRDLIVNAIATRAKEKSSEPPTRILLPIDMAWDLAKCGPDQLGPLAEKVLDSGVQAFCEHGLYGLSVILVEDRDAHLEVH